jgi:hypothetical protein
LIDGSTIQGYGSDPARGSAGNSLTSGKIVLTSSL